MSVTVGGVTFDGATGTPYPPLTEAQVEAWAAGAEAFRFPGSAPTGGGSVDTWADLGEADALARLRAAGGLVGSVVSVAYPHGTIAGLPVATVTGDWQARRGTVNGGVLVVRFTFDRTADKDGADTERTLVRVQTAEALAGPWIDEVGWAAFAGSDGLGTYVGESQATVTGQAPNPAKLGRWVRIVLKDASPVLPADIEWTGVIVGVSASARRDPASGIGWGSTATYRFAGVGHVLAQLFPQAWQEARETSPNNPTPYQGSTPVVTSFADIGEPPPFNGEAAGDRGQNLIDIDGSGQTVYLHARGAPGVWWTALQAARTCIAQIRRTTPTPLIVLNDLTPSILEYSATWEVARLSLLGMLAEIMSTEQERTFRVVVDWTASPPTLVVVPVNLAAAGTSYNLTGAEITDWRCDLDAATVADQWWLDAGPRSFLTTVEFVGVGTTTTGGVRGWSAAQEVTYAAAADANAKEATAIANVWHRFVIDPAWAGTDYLGGSAVPYTRQLDGGGQETGELTAATDYPQGIVAWRVERTLPIGSGQDWTAAYPATKLDPSSPREGPLVYWRKAGEPLAAVHFSQQVAVLDKVAGIELGRDSVDADATKAKLVTDGFAIVATLSFIHPLAWRVSKLVTSPRTDAPRQAFTYLPPDAFARVDTLAHAIVAVDGAGAAVHAAAGRMDRNPTADGLPGGMSGDLIAVRDRFARWYTTADGSAEWRRRTITTRTPDPGAIVASVVVTLDGGPPVVNATVLIGSPVTRRVVSWDLYNPGVTWSANRIVPALSGGGAGMVAAGAGAVALGRGNSARADGKRNA